MPAYGTTKIYAVDTVYHIYNRGAAKSDVFIDKADYLKFLKILDFFLKFPQGCKADLTQFLDKIQPLTLENMPVRVQTYCLMPNHFHLQVSLHELTGLTNLMRRVGVTYSGYFREKYNWSGTLFQGCFKALPIHSEQYFLYLPWYIHRNPLGLGIPIKELSQYPYSSYKWYLKEEGRPVWLDVDPVLSYFTPAQKDGGEFSSYKTFMEECDENPEEVLGDIGIDIPKEQNPEKEWREARKRVL